MPKANIMFGIGAVTLKYEVPLELDATFAGPQYARLRTLEYNRLILEGFSDALNRFNADNPISNEMLVMISFEGLPATERKE